MTCITVQFIQMVGNCYYIARQNVEFNFYLSHSAGSKSLFFTGLIA